MSEDPDDPNPFVQVSPSGELPLAYEKSLEQPPPDRPELEPSTSRE